MSLNLSKSPLWATIVIVGLIAATALVAGYVDRPGTEAQVVADEKCDSCPREGTPECCEVTGKCAESECADGDASTCASAEGACPSQTGCAAKAAEACSSEKATCAQEAGSPATCPKAAAAAADGCCGGGPCTRAQ